MALRAIGRYRSTAGHAYRSAVASLFLPEDRFLDHYTALEKRRLLFIRDVLVFTFTAFGGPQGHIAILLREFVEKRRYVTEEELMELNALAQVLPGPSSTQTLVGIAWKVGGLRLSIITFLIWIMPSAAIMCIAAIIIAYLQGRPVLMKCCVLYSLSP